MVSPGGKAPTAGAEPRPRELPARIWTGFEGRLLARVEKVAGLAETRAFAALIALQPLRHGWREEASRNTCRPRPRRCSRHPRAPLLPQMGSAALCRSAPLLPGRTWSNAARSSNGTLPTLVSATPCWPGWKANGNGARTENLTRTLYAYGADYLEILPPGTSVRADEIMWQMLGTRDGPRVARYYAQPASFRENVAEYLIEDITAAG